MSMWLKVILSYMEGILPKGPYLPCISMAGRALLAVYHRYIKLLQLEQLLPRDYPYHWVILDPKSKEDKVKVTNLKNSPKFQILKWALRATHPPMLLDKMCKYEMDPMSIVEDTERTRFCPQMDRWTDGETDKVIPVYPPFNFVEAGGIITHLHREIISRMLILAVSQQA